MKLIEIFIFYLQTTFYSDDMNEVANYQKWYTTGRCFMIVPKGSIDMNKRIIILRPNGKVDYDSHAQPVEGEGF